GPGRSVPEDGFRLCGSCGVALVPGKAFDELTLHRRNCSVRRAAEELRQKDKTRHFHHFDWRSVYLYRELRSEAIRLLLPLAADADLDTLTACLYLGLRLRFGGDPHHLVVAPQVIPREGLRRHHLILLDGVPGGTGYLKALYQQKDDEGRPGEGILDLLRRAHEALKTCRCRRLRADDRPDSDGCYRCIRAYHLQYRAGRISRERGIRLLEDLLRSGAKRKQASALSELKVTALYGSLLEKKFVDALRAFVENKEGIFEKALIRGAAGFRFMLPSSDRVWELELQPHLGKAHGVMVDSQPDFVLWCDDDGVRPL
ncbi:MAG: DUF1998 domain-containing protein, partial [bacterium]|nr:DUF1998 domain-containing protein [bacterium]